MAGYYDDYGFSPYVSVAERRRRAESKATKLSRSGKELSPILATRGGPKIAGSFWGQAWCSNLEAYSDYSNRLPRGRTYVRNGSVIDLKIEGGRVLAKVSGSRLYSVEIAIRSVSDSRWEDVKSACTGKIPSLLALLQGKIPGEIMGVVTDRDRGLFPAPAEIQLNCSCPDWATMCKHVAATLYGVGVRLDTAPELLFTLRGVDPEELVSAMVSDPSHGEASTSRRKVLDDDGMSSIFGIDLDLDGVDLEPVRPPNKRKKAGKVAGTVAASHKPATTKSDPHSKEALERLRSRAEAWVRDCEILDPLIDQVRLTRGAIDLSMGPGDILARIRPSGPRTVELQTKERSRWVQVDRGSLSAVMRRLRAAMTDAPG